MEQNFTYHAFICYSYKDESFAKKLQHYLEHYKLPKALQRQYPHLPKSLHPVFRDAPVLRMGPDGLMTALQCSRYLIVLCSENSTCSSEDGKNWMDAEIRMFLSLRPENSERIIPVILRQQGGLSPLECFPPILRELNILGIDLLQQGKKRAFFDVAARIAELQPDRLWVRQQRAQKRRRIITGVLTAAFAAIGGYGCWDYYVPHVSYYTDYIERNNLPEGLFELTKEEAAQRHRHYRFTSHKHRLRKVEHCGSVGTLQEHTESWNIHRPAALELMYDEAGNVRNCLHLDAQKNELFLRDFSRDCIDYVKATFAGELAALAPQATTRAVINTDESYEANADIGRFYVQRVAEGENQGLIVRELFCRACSLAPVQNAQGVGGYEYQLDSLGRPTMVRYIAVRSPQINDEDVVPVTTRLGIAGYMLTYGEGGQVSSLCYIGRDGAPILNDEGWARVTHRSINANTAEKRFYRTDGKPTLTAEGFSRLTMRYDERGNIVEETYFNTDDKPCFYKDGYARLTRRYDERGNIVETAYFDTDGKPCLNREGYARLTRQYDVRGNIVEETYFDTNGKSCLNRHGFSRQTNQYDVCGNVVEEAYFGIDNQPCLISDGYARLTRQYDERGNIVAETYFGTDGRPCLNRHNFSRQTLYYDKRGNIVEEAYFDTNGKPCLNREGYARLTRRYDERGNIVETACFDTDGKPCLNRQGFSRQALRYDERGNMLDITYYDQHGRILEK